MIYITGDCHAEFNRFSTKRFPAQKEMTKEDFVIVCGDFSGIWDYKISSNEETLNLPFVGIAFAIESLCRRTS